jgi:hypothetical protein
VAALALITGLAPDVFDIERPKPLAIGIDRELVALGMETEAVSDALHWWTHPARTSPLGRSEALGRAGAYWPACHRPDGTGSCARASSSADQLLRAVYEKRRGVRSSLATMGH